MNAPVSIQFEAIGTTWCIDLLRYPIGLSVDQLRIAILSRIDEYDQVYSRFRDDSVVAAISREPGTYEFPPDAAALFDIYFDLDKVTEGLFTPLIGDVLTDAGYDKNYSLRLNRRPTTPPVLNDVITRKDATTLKILKPCILDFGAAGKGYLVDIIGTLLESRGIAGYCIDAGGDILHHNQSGESYRVGLENPIDTSEAIGVATIANQSICGSSGNRRRWESYHHIINPRTLQSPTHIAAVWATAASGLVADAMTTALFFVDPSIVRNKYKFEFCIIGSDYTITRSAGFVADIFV